MSIATELARRNAKLERFIARIGTGQDDKELREHLEKTLSELNSRIKQTLKSPTIVSEQAQHGHWPAVVSEIKRFQQLNERLKQKEDDLMTAVVKASSGSSETSPLTVSPEHQQPSPPVARVRIRSLSQENLRADWTQPLLEDRDGHYHYAHRSEQALVEDEVEFDVQEVQQRHERLQQIERDVMTVHDMFKDVFDMVQDQGHSIDVIETHIENTRGYTAEAQKELVQAERYQNRQRKCKCGIAIVLLIVIAIVVIVVAVKA